MFNPVEVVSSIYGWWFDHSMISVPFATVGVMLRLSKLRNVRARGELVAAASGFSVEFTMFMLLVLRLRGAYVIGGVVTTSILVVALLVMGVATVLNWEDIKRERRHRALQRNLSRLGANLQALR